MIRIWLETYGSGSATLQRRIKSCSLQNSKPEQSIPVLCILSGFRQYWRAEPLFLGSAPDIFVSAPAPGKTYRLRLQKTDFDTKQLKYLNLNFKKAPINLDFVFKKKNTEGRVNRLKKYYLLMKIITEYNEKLTSLNHLVFHLLKRIRSRPKKIGSGSSSNFKSAQAPAKKLAPEHCFQVKKNALPRSQCHITEYIRSILCCGDRAGLFCWSR